MAGVGVGKRMLNQMWKATQDPSPTALLALRKGVHTSVYDKNVDDQIRSSVVTDGAIDPPESDNEKYWAPNPRTGVFGPATDHAAATTGGADEKTNVGAETVLEQQAWFRPLEDVEKPHQS